MTHMHILILLVSPSMINLTTNSYSTTNLLALIQTLDILCSHMLLILLDEEPLSPAGYLPRGSP